jgi:hypothetical protein
MPANDDPKKPTPSIAEINAYLEESAKRTKKRLPLAMGSEKVPAPEQTSRALPVVSPAPAAKPNKSE